MCSRRSRCTDGARYLRLRELRSRPEQAQSPHSADRRFDTIRIDDFLTEHLIAAAYTDHPRSMSNLLEHPRLHARSSHPEKVFDCGLRAWKENEIELLVR